MSNVIGIDFETYYSKDEAYSIRTQGGWNYVHDPRFDPYMISVADGSAAWAGHPRDFNWDALEGAHLVSHNRGFDNLVYKRMVELGKAPEIKFAAWDCTANLTVYLCNRRDLASSYQHLYKEAVDKRARSDADGKHWPNDFSSDERKEMLEYAKGDAIKCRRIWVDHSHKWPQWERELSNFTIEAGWRGINIDWDKVDSYLALAHGMLEETDSRLPWVLEGGKPTSPKEIAAHCRRCGIPAPPIKTHNPEDFAEWESQHLLEHPWIGCVSNHRSLNTLLKLLKTIKERRRIDGTMAFNLKYFGSPTGRWAGDGGVNLQNQRKDIIFRNEQGLMESDKARTGAAAAHRKETGSYPEWVTGTIDMRSIIIPRPGKKFVIADLAQIEPRILNWAAGNRSLLERIGRGMSIYEAFAREFMGWTEGNLKKEDPNLYALAKANVLGLGYGCGWEKFITVARAMAGIDLTKDDPEFEIVEDPATGETHKIPGHGAFSRKCVQTFRAANPAIKKLWGTLDDGFKRSYRGDFCIRLPSGRCLTYRNVRREVKMRPDKDGKPRKDWKFTAETDGRRYGFYGGKLTENLVQATARDVFALQLLAIHKSGIGDVVFHVHDEAVTEVPIESTSAKDAIVAMMSVAPEWAPDLPLGAEAVEASRYLK